MSKFTKRSVIVESVAAWEECVQCEGEAVVCATCKEYPCVQSSHSIGSENCSNCNGEGGRWHEATSAIANGQFMTKFMGANLNHKVTKSTILEREWGVCSMCVIRNEAGLSYACTFCQGTGCEPDTAGEWSVR